MARTVAQIPIARALGVHYPEATGFQRTQISSWLRGCGLTSGGGEAIAALKIYDKRGEWLTGNPPNARVLREAMTKGEGEFLAEAEGLKLRPFVHGVVWHKSRPGGAKPLDVAAKHALQAWAKAFAEAFPSAILCGPLNEPGMGGWIGDEAGFLEVQAIVGHVWTELGREWAATPEASIVSALAGAKAMLAELHRHGAYPTHWCLHMYGQGNDAPRHVADVQSGLEYAGCALPVIVEEYHFGFPPFGVDLSARGDLLERATGHYCADLALAFHAAGWHGCYFTLDTAIPRVALTNQSALPAATVAFWESVRARALTGTPRGLPNQRDFQIKTYRLLTEYRGALTAVTARRAARAATYPESA